MDLMSSTTLDQPSVHDMLWLFLPPSSGQEFSLHTWLTVFNHIFGMF